MSEPTWSPERKRQAVTFLMIACVILLLCLFYDRQDALRASLAHCGEVLR